MLEKHELQVNASRTSGVFLKNPKCLIYNSTMYEEQVFCFFCKIIVNCTVLVLMTYSVDCVHYISTVNLCDVRRMLYGNIMNSF